MTQILPIIVFIVGIIMVIIFRKDILKLVKELAIDAVIVLVILIAVSTSWKIDPTTVLWLWFIGTVILFAGHYIKNRIYDSISQMPSEYTT